MNVLVVKGTLECSLTLNLVQSSSEPALALRLTVRCLGSLIVAFMPLPHRSFLLEMIIKVWGAGYLIY
jgi:hypothetical protein